MTQPPTLDELSDELQCKLTAANEDEIRSYAQELQEVYESLQSPESPSTAVDKGEQSDDPNNALLSVYPDPRESHDSGPLDGLTVAMKDNIAVRNLRMSCGVQQMDYVPSFDATVVERLLDAGARIVGKANMDAFAVGPAGQWSEFGTVKNPRAADRVPGGSSSGSGAAVAAGLVDVALGTDTGGSIRSPAACCGVVGIRPTHRAVSRYGFVELAPSADTIGPLARDVDTAVRTLDAIAGHDPHDHTTVPLPSNWLVDTGDLTVGIIRSTVQEAAPAVQSQLEQAIDALETDTEVSITDVELRFGEVSKAFSICLGAEFMWLVRQSSTVRGQGVQYNSELRSAISSLSFNEHIASRMLPGALLDAETGGDAYTLARREVEAFTRRLDDLFNDVDVVLTPTLRILPPTFGEIQDAEEGLNYSYTKPFSLTGGPAVSVPVGSADGLPISAQVIAPPFKDGSAVRTARLLEAVTPSLE